MANLSNIQFRLNSADKKKFAKILDEVGLDMPSAFRIFVKKVINSGGLPFKAQKLTENGFTIAEEKEILKRIEESKDPKNRVGPFKDAASLIKSLNS